MVMSGSLIMPASVFLFGWYSAAAMPHCSYSVVQQLDHQKLPIFANIAINGFYLNNPHINYLRLISILMSLILGFSPKKPLLQQNMGKTTRVVVCGLKGVGKTAILEQLIYGNVTKTTVWINSVFSYFIAFSASSIA